MRILVMQFQGGGVGHYRLAIPARELKRIGMEVEIADGAFAKDLRELEKFIIKNWRDYDLVHINYMNDTEAIKLFLAGRNYAGCPIISDVDDDLYNVPQYNTAYRAYHGGASERRVARMQLRVSDAVSVSTAPLLEVLKKDCNAIEQLPNCLDLNDWTNEITYPPTSDESIRVMFAGNIGRYGDLAEVKDAVNSTMRQHPNVRLFFMGCAPDWSTEWAPSNTDPKANRCFYIRPCDVKHYAKILRWVSPDILINPVQCNKFNASKSHIKAFDAAMVGAALVCTDWQTHDEVPNDCAMKLDNTTVQWEEGLAELIRNAELRKSLASKLREWALATQTIDKHIHKWVKFYEKVIAKGPISSLDGVVRPDAGGDDGMVGCSAASGNKGQAPRQGIADVWD